MKVRRDDGSRWLNRVVDYLHWRAQDAASQADYEDLTLALRILGQCRRGLPNVAQAYLEAFGTNAASSSSRSQRIRDSFSR